MKLGEGVGMGPPWSTGAGTPWEAGGMEGMSDDRKLAMFMDFENIVRGVKEAQYKQFEIKLVLERLVEKGKIMVKRAYADWNRYAEYKRPFHEHAIELIDVPQSRYSGKNSADIRMVVDALDLCYTRDHINTFALLTGDSDFSPLVSKLSEYDKQIIGLGVKNSSAELLVNVCDEFIFYDDVIAEDLRVTVIATGLGQPQVTRQSKPQLVVRKTGTDNMPVGGVDYRVLDEMPAVIRKNRATTVEALQANGVDKYDIPAFLRKQAD